MRSLIFCCLGALVIVAVLGTVAQASVEDIPFKYVEIDASIAGDCKAVGDLDGDQKPDLVVGGMPGEKLNWYRYPTWTKTVIATPAVEFTTDCALGDVDSDGDLDIVVPDGSGTDNFQWFENPRPTGDPAVGSQWTKHVIGTIGNYGKDVKLADYDGNGRLDAATRSNTSAMIFFQTAADTWSKVTLSVSSLGDEGMAHGDIDGDDDIDLVVQGAWLRNPGGADARTPANWSEFAIGEAPSSFKALVVDLNRDDKMDVLFSSSEGTADVNWWTPSTGDPTAAWTKETIVASLERAHTLQAADMDQDGDMDVVLAQMHTSLQKEVMVQYNVDGLATDWQKQVVGTGGLHNGVVADIGSDGDYDIFGANWTGNPPVKLWVNQLALASITLSVEPTGHMVCRPAVVTSTIEVSSTGGYNQAVTLSDSDLPGGVSTGFSSNPVFPLPGTSVYAVSTAVNAADGSYVWPVHGTSPTLTDDVTVTLVIHGVAPASTTLTWQPNTPSAGRMVTFTAETAGLEPLGYAWDFGDGETGSGAVVTHTYDTSATYTVVLTATNPCGEDSAQGDITVLDTGTLYWIDVDPVGHDICRPTVVTSTIEVSSTGDYNEAVTLSDSGLPSGVSTGFSSNPVFPLPGTSVYTISIAANAADGSYAWPVHGTSPTLTDDVTVTLVIYGVAPASTTLTWQPNTPSAGRMVTFTAKATGSEPLGYAWDFGDGETGNGAVVTHTYDTSATYTVVLTATNPCGEDSAQGDITVLDTGMSHWIYLPLILRQSL